MIVCDKRKLIYIRVPKTASTSFYKALVEDGAEQIGRTHATAAASQALAPEKWAAYHKLAFIRHPLAWVISVWRHNQTSAHPALALFARRITGLEEFVRWLPATPMDWIVDHKGRVLVDKIEKAENTSGVLSRYGLADRHENKDHGDTPHVSRAVSDLVAKKFAREWQYYA